MTRSTYKGQNNQNSYPAKREAANRRGKKDFYSFVTNEELNKGTQESMKKSRKAKPKRTKKIKSKKTKSKKTKAKKR